MFFPLFNIFFFFQEMNFHHLSFVFLLIFFITPCLCDEEPPLMMNELLKEARDASAAGRHDAAAYFLNEALHRHPREAKLWFKLGKEFLAMNDKKGAAAAFRSCSMCKKGLETTLEGNDTEAFSLSQVTDSGV